MAARKVQECNDLISESKNLMLYCGANSSALGDIATNAIGTLASVGAAVVTKKNELVDSMHAAGLVSEEKIRVALQNIADVHSNDSELTIVTGKLKTSLAPSQGQNLYELIVKERVQTKTAHCGEEYLKAIYNGYVPPPNIPTELSMSNSYNALLPTMRALYDVVNEQFLQQQQNISPKASKLAMETNRAVKEI